MKLLGNEEMDGKLIVRGYLSGFYWSMNKVFKLINKKTFQNSSQNLKNLKVRTFIPFTPPLVL